MVPQLVLRALMTYAHWLGFLYMDSTSTQMYNVLMELKPEKRAICLYTPRSGLSIIVVLHKYIP